MLALDIPEFFSDNIPLDTIPFSQIIYFQAFSRLKCRLAKKSKF